VTGGFGETDQRRREPDDSGGKTRVLSGGLNDTITGGVARPSPAATTAPSTERKSAS
jgi:hypothetical protein